MFKYYIIIFLFLSLSLLAQDIPDYRGEYVFTNSKISMKGIRQLITNVNGKRTIQFKGKFPLGRINIVSDFSEKNDQMKSSRYFVDVKWTLISDKRTLDFDDVNRTLTATGKYKWKQKILENENIFDPLNVQIQIRKNVISGLKNFSLMLPDLKTGAIEVNAYQVIGNGEFEVDGYTYQCIIVERVRFQENRTTRYFLAPDLDHLIVKVEDQDEDGDTSLELKKLY